MTSQKISIRSCLY